MRVRRLGHRQLTQRGVFGHAGNLGKTTIQRAIAAWRTSVFKRALMLSLVGQDHLANRFAAADGRIDEAHDDSPLVYFSVVKGRRIALFSVGFLLAPGYQWRGSFLRSRMRCCSISM
jgi:hypothetical protein